MPESINSKLKEQYDHDDSGGSLDTNLGDFLDSEGASGTSNNSKWRDWASGTGTSLNTRLFHKHGGSGSFMTRWKNWIAFSSTHSFNFDGSNDYLDAGNGQSLGFSGADAFSISAWVYADVVNANQVILAFGSDTSSSPEGKRVAMFLASTAKPTLAFWGNDVVSAGTISAGQWVHLAMTFAGGNRTSANSKIYINGVSQTLSGGTASALDLSDMDFVHIGADQAIGQKFNGLIDEVAIWDVALDSNDITSVYNNGKIIDLSKSASYGTDRTGNLKLWLRCGDKAEPESTTAIARQDFYTDFDGTDDHIEIQDADEFSFGDGSSDSPFSVNAWVYFNSTASAVVLQKGTAFASSEYSIGTDINSKMYFHLLDDGGSGTGYLGRKYNTALSTGEWYHFGATYDGSTNNSGVKLYLNGIRVDDTDAEGGTYTAMGNLSGDAFIGRNDTSYSNFRMSNLSLHKTELDAQTISQMAKSRFTPMRDNRFSVVSLDGTNDFIDCGNGSSLQFSGSFSIGCWFRTTDATATNEILISKADDGVSAGWLIRLNSSRKLDFSYLHNASGGSGIVISDTGSVVNDGQWYHVMFVHESGVGNRAYKNGVLVGSNSTGTDLGSHTPNFHIGNQDFSTARALACDVSSASAYNVAKSTEEVYAIYQQGITYDESSLSGLVGYWRMGDGANDAYPTIADSSSNSNDGTITNGASDDVVQQMVAGYDMGAFESSEELGIEKVDNNTTSAYGNGSESNIANVTNGVAITYAGLGTGLNAIFSDDSLLNVNILGTDAILHKLTFNAYYEGGSSGVKIRIYHPAENKNYVSDTLTTSSTSYTFYLVGSHAGIVFQQVNMSSGNVVYITDMSFKEVLQSADLSDTFPFIADVNEPVLGVELVDNNTVSGWGNGAGLGYGSNTVANVTNGVKITHVDNAGGAQGNFTDAGLLNADQTSGKTYKVKFNAYYSGGTAPNVKIWTGAVNAGIQALTTSEKEYIIYFVNAGTASLFFDSVNGSQEIYILNLSTKEVQGNVGTMTNQDSADLVYSSVLPDQSFLTGVNSAYNFIDLDGSNEFISGSISRGDAITEFTLSTWTNIDSFGDYERIFVGDDGQVRAGFKSTGHFTFYPNSTIGDTDSTGSAYSTGQWYHTMVTYNKATTTLKYYRDGALAFTKDDCSSSDIDISGPFWIGSYRGSFLFLDGSVGQTAIWDKDLSSDVGSIYNLGRHGNLLDSYSDNLLGYWAMSALDAKTGLSDVGNGTIYDRSGNSNHGTPTNIESTDLKSSPNAEPNGYAKGDTNRSTTTP